MGAQIVDAGKRKEGRARLRPTVLELRRTEVTGVRLTVTLIGDFDAATRTLGLIKGALEAAEAEHALAQWGRRPEEVGGAPSGGRATKSFDPDPDGGVYDGAAESEGEFPSVPEQLRENGMNAWLQLGGEAAPGQLATFTRDFQEGWTAAGCAFNEGQMAAQGGGKREETPYGGCRQLNEAWERGFRCAMLDGEVRR